MGARSTATRDCAGSLPTEEAALVLLLGLIVHGQIRLRRLDGWRRLPAGALSTSSGTLPAIRTGTMHSPRASSLELDVTRIRGLSEHGRHHEALVAAEALAVALPKNRDVLYLVAVNQRCLHRIDDALETLRRLEQLHPRFSLLYQERGYCYTTLRDAPRAIASFLRGVDINPALAKTWSMLERLFRMTGDARNAAAAAEHLSSLRSLPSEVVRAGSLFSDGDLSPAASILREYLCTSSDDVEALRLLGRIQHQRDVLDEAE